MQSEAFSELAELCRSRHATLTAASPEGDRHSPHRLACNRRGFSGLRTHGISDRRAFHRIHGPALNMLTSNMSVF